MELSLGEFQIFSGQHSYLRFSISDNVLFVSPGPWDFTIYNYSHYSQTHRDLWMFIILGAWMDVLKRQYTRI